MVLDRTTGALTDSMVADIASFIEPRSIVVFNDSRVRKARVYGVCEQTGAHIEFIFLAPITPNSLAPAMEIRVVAPSERIPPKSRLWRAVCSKSGRQKPGRSYSFPGELRGSIVEEIRDEKIIEFDRPIGDEYFNSFGHVPLPPYIKRADTADDEQRYQTVYAARTGSAASPTAGLHFTPEILESLRAKGIAIEYVTLHVGLGTFLPVRTENVEDHRMHEEWFEITPEVAAKINDAKASGKKIYAVGTTSLRSLESAWFEEALRAGSFSTRIFIYPGFKFHVVDSLFTNFHTPKSTLLMLVSAFAGREKILEAYRSAIEKNYRFFSYGDAMLIT